MRKTDFKSAVFTNFTTPAHILFPINTTGSADIGQMNEVERFGNKRVLAHHGGNRSPEIVPKGVLLAFFCRLGHYAQFSRTKRDFNLSMGGA